MSLRVNAILSGLISAVIAAFLFWGINSTHQVNGVGLLRRSVWPFHSLGIWMALGAVVGIIGSVVRAARKIAHSLDTQELAEEKDRDFEESFSLPPGASTMPVFAGWSEGRNVMSDIAGGLALTVFDYTTISRGSDSHEVTNGTVALVPVEGLPSFDLRPRTFGRRLLGWVGFEGLTFDPSASNRVDAETVRRFAELFHLAAVDPLVLLGTLSENSPPEPTGDDAVRRLFTPAVMEVLNRYPGYAIQSQPGFLAVWQGSGVLPPRERTALWNAALKMRNFLTHLPEGGRGPAIPARAGTDASRQARKLRNTLVGGVGGLFVGFIVAAMVMSVAFFRHAPGQRLEGEFGLNTFVYALLFVGPILLGVAIGAGIGSRVPVREIVIVPGPVEDPARRKSRERATGCGVAIGFFGGFFGGFAIFVSAMILLDGKPDDFGIVGALFFGSIFGGGFFGAVTCGILANRLTRWRQSRSVDAPGVTSPPRTP